MPRVSVFTHYQIKNKLRCSWVFNKCLFLELFIVLALVFSASTYPSFGQDIRYVRGDLSCKQFVDIQDKNVEEADKYVYWLGGVLTGHSLAVETPLERELTSLV